MGGGAIIGGIKNQGERKMLKTQKIIAAAACVTLALSALALASCGGHTHSFSETWEKDATHHWHVCECTEKDAYAPHEFGEWVIETEATETATGSQNRTCATCGFAQTEVIPIKEHKHTYASEYSYNDSEHWRVSTCGHDVEKNRGKHAISGGACSICGYVDVATLYTFTETTADDGTAGYEIAVKQAALSKETLTIPETYRGKSVVAIAEQGLANTAIKTIALPASIRSLGDYAFWKSAIEEITIPDTVKVLGTGVFYECEQLNKVELGSGVETLPTYLFSNTPSLKTVTVPDGVKTIAKSAFYLSSLISVTLPDSVTTLQENAFQQSADLETVVLGKGITKIPVQCFYKCVKLKPFSFENITSIGHHAFCKCTAFEAEVPATVTIGEKAFQESGIKSVVWNKSSTSTDEFMNCTELISVEFTDNVTSIADAAFKDCTALKTIKIGKAVKTISDKAFIGCTARETITISQENTNFSVVNNTLLARQGLILKLANAAGEIPSTVSTIAAYAFYGHKTLETLVLPANVKHVQTYAFYGCEKLKSVTLMPDSEKGSTCVDSHAFENCRALTTVVVPDKIAGLGKSVFKGCTALQSVRFEYAASWNVYRNNETGTAPLISVDVTDPARNAEYFTGTYADYQWKNSARS